MILMNASNATIKILGLLFILVTGFVILKNQLLRGLERCWHGI